MLFHGPVPFTVPNDVHAPHGNAVPQQQQRGRFFKICIHHLFICVRTVVHTHTSPLRVVLSCCTVVIHPVYFLVH